MTGKCPICRVRPKILKVHLDTHNKSELRDAYLIALDNTSGWVDAYYRLKNSS